MKRSKVTDYAALKKYFIHWVTLRAFCVAALKKYMISFLNSIRVGSRTGPMICPNLSPNRGVQTACKGNQRTTIVATRKKNTKIKTFVAGLVLAACYNFDSLPTSVVC